MNATNTTHNLATATVIERWGEGEDSVDAECVVCSIRSQFAVMVHDEDGMGMHFTCAESVVYDELVAAGYPR